MQPPLQWKRKLSHKQQTTLHCGEGKLWRRTWGGGKIPALIENIQKQHDSLLHKPIPLLQGHLWQFPLCHTTGVFISRFVTVIFLLSKIRGATVNVIKSWVTKLTAIAPSFFKTKNALISPGGQQPYIAAASALSTATLILAWCRGEIQGAGEWAHLAVILQGHLLCHACRSCSCDFAVP